MRVTPTRGVSRARAALLGLCLVAPLVAGCYSLVPVATGHPPLGATVALDINDAGRVALGGSIGPEVRQLEGRLVQRDSVEYVLAVTAVHLLRGGVQNWSGERVRVPTQHVRGVQERRFSKTKTAAMAGVMTAAVVLIFRQSLLGLGQPDPAPDDTGSGELSRIPWPLVRH